MTSAEVPFQIIIDEIAERKIRANGVSAEEVQEILGSPRSGQAASATTGRPIAFGRTRLGRTIAVVFTVELTEPLTLSVITAYEPEPDETDDQQANKQARRSRQAKNKAARDWRRTKRRHRG